MNNQTALLFIDWQEGFVELARTMPRNNPRAEENAARLLAHWLKRCWPVVHVRHNSTEEDSPLREGHDGFAFRDFARPAAGEPVFVKRAHAAFIGTGLEAHLRERGIGRLVLSGVRTDHCVSTTARMAHDLGFKVMVAGDACHAFACETPQGRVIDARTVHDVNLASLHGEFGRVVETAALLKA
jgi:nicotinamidase-related amidase